ncbi:hypothetical protein PoB_005270100 [Plakobranchus ocellatus]|uniref:Uncharacterized protein n=1 Tax=Plakobranchus ocellatus TaxID=259542 RepID=A0AAV4C0B0_9GAST|nr:hypothetical protein PoB_005270100 [Plakobranchus ocellatus]
MWFGCSIEGEVPLKRKRMTTESMALKQFLRDLPNLPSRYCRMGSSEHIIYPNGYGYQNLLPYELAGTYRHSQLCSEEWLVLPGTLDRSCCWLHGLTESGSLSCIV